MNAACDVAGPQPNGPFTPEYCAPRVIHHMCDPHAPPMAGPPDDVWGLAVTFHQLLTSVDLAREPTFGPYAEDGMHIVDLQTALMREHNIWVSCMQSKIRDALLSLPVMSYYGACANLSTA